MAQLPLETVLRLLNNTKGIMQIGVKTEKGSRPNKGLSSMMQLRKHLLCQITWSAATFHHDIAGQDSDSRASLVLLKFT